MPVIAVLLFIAVVPFALMLSMSLSNLHFAEETDGSYVGFEHYAEIIEDQRLQDSVVRTIVFVALAVPIECAIGLLLATSILRAGRFGAICLPVICLPCLLAPVTVGLLWRMLLKTDYGPLGYMLHTWGLADRSILGDPIAAFTAIVAVDVWQWTPFFVIVLVAALKTMSPSMKFAAEIDGAGPIASARTITIPLLFPVIATLLVIRALDAIKEFDKPFTMTGGGPASSTELLSVYLFRRTFEHGDVAYAAAIGAITFAAILIVTNIALRLARAHRW